jgi:hypothetical protein
MWGHLKIGLPFFLKEPCAGPIPEKNTPLFVFTTNGMFVFAVLKSPY